MVFSVSKKTAFLPIIILYIVIIDKSRFLKVNILFSKLVYETSGTFMFTLTLEESESVSIDREASDMLIPFWVKPSIFKLVFPL